MTTVKDILEQKLSSLWSIHPKASILDALKIMSRRDVGALPVVDEMGLVGIVSERDFVHVIAKLQQCEIDRKIDRYMNKNVVTVTSEHHSGRMHVDHGFEKSTPFTGDGQ